MEELSKEWFELRDHRRRQFSRAVWIPIYGIIFPIKHLEYPEIGHIEETFAVGSATIFNDTCSIPDDHITPRRWALFMARSVLRDIREGARHAIQAA